MTYYRKQIGKLGEDKACEYLENNGYKILERNWKCKIGEIDIIAKKKTKVKIKNKFFDFIKKFFYSNKNNGDFRKDDTLVFIEVKTKTGSGYGSPEEMVDLKKQQKLINLAQYYLSFKKLTDINWRIDVIAIEEDKISHIPNAVIKD